jgi:hypothetical protein
MAMSISRRVCVALLLLTTAFAADDNSLESLRADQDVALSTDPVSSFWSNAPAVYAEKDRYGKQLSSGRTEIRSRWTQNYLYFLFVCPYDTLYLKPAPDTSTETYELWDWDVAEVFIGSDFQNIRRYKEFEVSPQGEWVDLSIDLGEPHHEQGWKWNSGFTILTRIDRPAKIWYAALRIPFAALDQARLHLDRPLPGAAFRLNFFRIEGPPPQRKHIVWRPTMRETFHVPERFGLLKLVSSSTR